MPKFTKGTGKDRQVINTTSAREGAQLRAMGFTESAPRSTTSATTTSTRKRSATKKTAAKRAASKTTAEPTK